MLAPPEQGDPVMQAIATGSRDANSPDARAFAIRRLHQLVRAGLLGGMPQNMSDPTATWRGLSATLAPNPDALTQFLAAAQTPAVHPAAQAARPPSAAPELVSEHGYMPTPAQAPAPELVSEHGYHPAPHYAAPELVSEHGGAGSATARLRAAILAMANMQGPASGPFRHGHGSGSSSSGYMRR